MLGIQGTHLNIIKTENGKPLAKINFNEENLKANSLKSGTRQGCPLPSLLLNIVFKVLARAIRQSKEIKKIQIGEEEVKVSLFADDVVYRSDLKIPPENSYKWSTLSAM